MHASSLVRMSSLLSKYVMPGDCLVYDIGSMQVNKQPTYRPLVESLHLKYHGIDIEPGPNVDIVVSEDGEWLLAPNIPNPGWVGVVEDQAEICISGQCLEHVKRPWVWIRQVFSLVKQGGTVIIIAPWNAQQHRHPVDCWRIFPDGMEVLFSDVGARTLEVGLDPNGMDCWGVARKGA